MSHQFAQDFQIAKTCLSVTIFLAGKLEFVYQELVAKATGIVQEICFAMVDVVVQKIDVPAILNVCMGKDALKDIVLDPLTALMIWIAIPMNGVITIFAGGMAVMMIEIAN